MRKVFRLGATDLTFSSIAVGYAQWLVPDLRHRVEISINASYGDGLVWDLHPLPFRKKILTYCCTFFKKNKNKSARNRISVPCSQIFYQLFAKSDNATINSFAISTCSSSVSSKCLQYSPIKSCDITLYSFSSA